MSSQTQRTRCPKCGNEFHPNFRICPKCGEIITKDQTSPKPNPASAPPPFVPPQQVRPAAFTSQPAPSNTAGWGEAPVAPWRRWAARSADLMMNGMIMSALLAVVLFSLAPFEANSFYSFLDSPPGYIIDLMLSSFLGCILTGLIIGATGSSLGKIMFGIRICNVDGTSIGLVAGLTRDIEVWVKGLGIGFPLISLITQVVSYNNLQKLGSTPWDAGKYKVTYRPNEMNQYLFNTIGIIALIILASFRQAFLVPILVKILEITGQ